MRSEPLGSIHSGLLGDATLADRLGAALRDALGERVRGEHDALRVRARTPGDVSSLFRIAAQHGARVAAPGGELTPGVGVVSLDLDALAQIRSLDAESRIVHVEGGALLGAVEAHLRAAGLTLGVATLDAATLDAATLDAATGARHAARAEARAISAAAEARVDVASWLARGAVGARAHADDPVDQLVCGLEVVLADGTLLTIRPAPRRAVGPDLLPSFVGGRACLGVIVGAHLVARSVVPHTDVVYRFAARADAESARAWIRGRGVRPVSTALNTDDGDVTYLQVRVEGHRAIRDASLATVARVALERGGRICEPPVAPRDHASVIAPPSDVVRALARALDPAGILRA